MERNAYTLSRSPPPPPDISCANELNRSNSCASTLTAEICEDIFHHSTDNSTMWTDEKHSSYLEHLEVSFVKQLHQSINLLGQCSNRQGGDKIIPQVHPVNARHTFEKLAAPVPGCEKINSNRGDPLSQVSDDSEDHLRRPWIHISERIGTKCPTASVCALDASQNISANNQYCDSQDSVKEGTGQNFSNENEETNACYKSRAKRLKTALPE